MASEYFSQHEIQGMLDGLVKKLAVEQPEDPSVWLASQLGGFPCAPATELLNGHPTWYNPACMTGADIRPENLLSIV